MTTYKIIFHPLVHVDLKESFNWYRKRKEELGNLFYEEVNKKIVEIASDPERYPFVFKNFRQAHIKKFPFVIVYEFVKKEEYVLISSVFHSKRNPKLKFRK